MELIRSYRFWLGVLLSGFCLWLALRGVPFKMLFSTLEEARYVFLAPVAILQLAYILILTLRWRTLLGPEVRLRDTLWAQGTGYLFNNVFPLRLGDIARSFAIFRCSSMPLVHVMSTVVVERLVDVLMVILALLAVLPFMAVPPAVARTGVLFAAVSLGALGVMALFARGRQWVELRFPFLARGWSEYGKSFDRMVRPEIALSTLSLSLIAWALLIGMYWCILKAFHPQAEMVEAAFMVVALSFAITIPSTPGFIGVFQFIGQQALLIPFGDKYSAGCALCVALTAHLTYYLSSTAVGAIGVWQLGFTLPGLSRAVSSARTVSPHKNQNSNHDINHD